LCQLIGLRLERGFLATLDRVVAKHGMRRTQYMRQVLAEQLAREG
jgi:hypothetical protein